MTSVRSMMSAPPLYQTSAIRERLSVRGRWFHRCDEQYSPPWSRGIMNVLTGWLPAKLVSFR
jgi:hypothetical protein